ncbi:sigma-70 family RNA polymerase sigma factor [Streptomyces anulatus]|uniref:RNA polymerase sigma factor n=1 Tax=Streptomyces anulatus TaxID=1892 RepID=UPI0034241A44
MTIVAERPVISAGLADEIERQERDDNARGPEPESFGRRATRSYTGAVRVDLRTAEDRPLTAAQTVRVAELAAEHGDHLVRYVAARLGGAAYWAEAQDVAQDVWVAVARGRLPQIFEASDEYAWPRLAATARYAAMEAARTDRPREMAALDETVWDQTTSGRDETACAVLDLDAENGPWAPGCYADVIAALSPRQREVLELRVRDAMTQEAVAARLGIGRRAVQLHEQAALLALRGGRVATTLPDGWQTVVDRLPSPQCEMVALVASGVSQREAARRLGLSRNWAVRQYQRGVESVREMVIDHRMDPVQAAPAKKAGGCARPCATGCALRRGAEVTV